jgi:23S rRNA (cytosine1962-C5)-methyltransferase
VSSAFENRLRKNLRHRRRWAARAGLTAYRVYDRDLPELPYVVEWYAGRAHVVEFPPRRGVDPAVRAGVLEAVKTVLEVPAEWIFTKTHTPQPWGRSQYGREGAGGEHFLVQESGLQFWVNLSDYLDTGLFLDHRVTRGRVREEAKGQRFLNLFAYTGSFTVYAAAGGATQTTTVDLSSTYCEWAEENLIANGFGPESHRVIRADVVRWLAEEEGSYDLVVLDPPSFSASKKMSGRFDVQRDHPRLIAEVERLLSPRGVLYFSTNFTGFQLQEDRLSGLQFEELTPGSIPEDFHLKEIHRCWRVTRRR